MGPLFKPPYQKIKLYKEKGKVNKIVKYLDYRKEEHIPALAADALGELKNAKAVEPLIKIIEHSPVGNTTTSALKALAKIGDKRSIEPIYEFLKKRHWSEAAVALDRLGWKPTSTLEKVHYYLVKDQRNKLYELGADAIETLVEIMEGGTPTAADVLGQIGDSRAVDPLLIALKSNPNEYVKKAAAEALGKINTDKAVEPLISALFDAHHSVSSSAAEALGSIGDTRAVEPLLKVLEYNKDSSVILALGKLKDSRATNPLVGLLGNEDRYVRRNAVVALKDIGDSLAINGLIEMLNREEDQFVIENAIASLEKIRHQMGDLNEETKSQISETLNRMAQQEDLKRQEESLLEGKVKAMSEKEMLQFLKQLCNAYSSNSNYKELEPKGKKIGERINELGGLRKMRAIYSMLEGMPGSRTLELLWNNIGEWRS